MVFNTDIKHMIFRKAYLLTYYNVSDKSFGFE